MMNCKLIFVDATGLKCPLPVLKARKALQSLETGSRIRVISTDPASPLDFKHFCGSKGHVLVSINEEKDKIEFVIEKGEDQEIPS
ncbi:MAG: preprotein translocase subunit TatB [Rhodospirillaceae bacterium]|nr:preprotein translocase subunit TatB [Rhodospirillaceae bacterium]|tara:strand:- start:2311 stop:2565 length:255 start_codon:yes stop_codon:yes gene_type:complete